MSNVDPKDMNATIDFIAKDVFRVDTLEVRKRDSLDFYDCSVWQIKEALERAYKAGQLAAQRR